MRNSNGENLRTDRRDVTRRHQLPLMPNVIGGVPIVRFLIVSSSPETREAIVRVLSKPQGMTLPGASGIDGLTITVCDPAGCYLAEPSEELTGRQGFAAYLEPTATNICQPTSYDIAPHWEVFAICCNTNFCSEV